MKKFIQETVKEQIRNGETPAIFFETCEDFGHVQFQGGHWSIFFNASCIKISKALTPIVKKLQQLNVTEFDFQQ